MDPYVGDASHGSEKPIVETDRRPAEGPLTLSEAIRVALANNPELAATGYEVDAARARQDAAAGQRLPSLHAVAGFNRYLDDQRLLPVRENGELGVFSRDIFGGDLVVRMPLYTGGRLTREVEAAELLRQAAEHRLARSRQELVFNVSSVFYSILAQGKVIESLEFSQKALNEHLKQVDNLIASERAARVDRLRTEVRLADLQQRLVREKNVLKIQGLVLTNLLGLPEDSPPVSVAGQLASEWSPTQPWEASLDDAYLQREDYLAAKATLEAQAKVVDAARAGHLPTVSLVGSYGERWTPDASERPPGTSTSDAVGVVGVTAEIPLFEGGQIDARVRQEQARLSAARHRLRELKLQIRLDVETAVSNVQSAHERILATETAVTSADESLRTEREKYDIGRGSITDVLDAQSALLDSQTNYYQAMADYNTALAQVRLAVGKQM
ncbi:MAG TPA: TolC family protein [Sedimentisphaerales bacterium]|nr:TolC family protein [Sedimentisphaerales bacterium]HRS12570.1 TolC family protein [Sedimentisphaerales bacterium]HRV49182.1 TolC family protein [Sedimentisphaerales bacterium]